MKYIIGADEVGRGCLAGPVHVCGVAIPSDTPRIAGVKDSKKLTPHQRERMNQTLQTVLGDNQRIASRDAARIDAVGINGAIRECFLEVVGWLLMKLQGEGHEVEVVRIDGPAIWEPQRLRVPTEFIINGDDLDWIIGSASIVAKVARDASMREIAAQHPVYGWERNKGYGTANHIAAIREHGLTHLHRQKFCRGFGGKVTPNPKVFEDDVNVFDLFD